AACAQRVAAGAATCGRLTGALRSRRRRGCFEPLRRSSVRKGFSQCSGSSPQVDPPQFGQWCSAPSMSRQIVLTRPWHNSSLPTLVVDGRARRSDVHILPNGVTAQGGRPPMTSSQSPETSLINGHLGTNEGSAFSTRHAHVVPIVDSVSSKVTPRHPVA